VFSSVTSAAVQTTQPTEMLTGEVQALLLIKEVKSRKGDIKVV